MTSVKSLDLLSPLREASSAPAGKETREAKEEEAGEAIPAPQGRAEPLSVRSRLQAVPWDPGARQARDSEAEAQEMKVGTVRDRFRRVHWEPVPEEALTDGMTKEEVEERAAEFAERHSVRSVFARMK